MPKRIFDIFFAGLGLILLSPLFVLVAIAIKFDSKGPVFFRQDRVGQYGRIFKIHKFRTMSVRQDSKDLQITVGADHRITNVGHFLRKTKLDEIAQLVDVLKGDMSLVGPRPEVPKYVSYYPSDVKGIVLSVKPGITDRASIEFKDESAMLGQSTDPEKTYIQKVLPIKLNYYVDYAKQHTILGDLFIILSTIKALLNH